MDKLITSDDFLTGVDIYNNLVNITTSNFITKEEFEKEIHNINIKIDIDYKIEFEKKEVLRLYSKLIMKEVWYEAATVYLKLLNYYKQNDRFRDNYMDYFNRLFYGGKTKKYNSHSYERFEEFCVNYAYDKNLLND